MVVQFDDDKKIVHLVPQAANILASLKASL
jgi:hypothetical protein